MAESIIPSIGALHHPSPAVRALAHTLNHVEPASDCYGCDPRPKSAAINLRLSAPCEGDAHDLCAAPMVQQGEGRTWQCRCLCHNARRLELVR